MLVLITLTMMEDANEFVIDCQVGPRPIGQANKRGAGQAESSPRRVTSAALHATRV